MTNSCYVQVVNDAREVIELTVDYSYEVCRDAYGTGDSPDTIEITEYTVELSGFCLDGLLNEETLIYIEQKILQDVREYE
jgi:uncharacterized membrane protein YhdT